MNFSDIKVTYNGHLGTDLDFVNAARVSVGTTSETLEERDEKLINYLAKNQHMTPFEHCYLRVIIECPLFIRSQIHRHRTFSYNEISRRYTAENISFYLPKDLHMQQVKNKQGSGGVAPDSERCLDVMGYCMEESVNCYNDMVDLGISREEARMILPQNLMTKFWMSGNFRNWCHFLSLRLDKHSQFEVRTVAQQIGDILNDHFPVGVKALLEV